MRDLPWIWDCWDSDGPFVGERATRGVVTVEPDWYLNLSEPNIGTSKKGPFRWFQRADNSQQENEIPNVLSIQWDRSVETDAASCRITLSNFWLDFENPAPNPGELGEPGYFTWNRGESDDAQARWNHESNIWNQILVPNALLRTYEGYTSRDKEWEDAKEAGEIVLTGVWLIDEINISTQGTLNITCRDMAKLLIEQQVYLPLVPEKEYPLKYMRWVYKDFDASFDTRPPPLPPGGSPAAEKPVLYYTSSADKWYGVDANIHGHTGRHSTDGDPNTFALSVGNSSPLMSFCTDYWEYICDTDLEWIYVHTWGGNYQMYISIFEHGGWVDGGHGLIPYDETPLVGTQPTVVDTGADIPFVTQFGVPWEEGRWYRLPRRFNAHKFRITFRNHTQSPWGPWFYRCGIREVKVGSGVRESSQGQSSIGGIPWTFGMAAHPVGEGYWVVDDFGKVFAFGDARLYDKVGGGPQDASALAIRSTPSGDGYWVMLENGRVHAYGNANHFGDAALATQGDGAPNFIDMAVTSTGLGYYLLRRSGEVFAYGDANWYGDATNDVINGDPAYRGTGIETHPSLDGYWVVNGDGEVTAFGSVPDHGGLTARGTMVENEWIRAIRRTNDGGGYYLLRGAGGTFVFGNAQVLPGSIQNGIGFDPDRAEEPIYAFQVLSWDMAVSSGENGYWVLQAGGMVSAFGGAQFFGYPGSRGIMRYPGNYLDYVDIIRELLLWGGWLLEQDEYDSEEPPPVYGNLESTGAYSDEPLSEDIFDKKPIMDGITTIKEIVGYLFWVDEEGAAHFESPNWWQTGNFYEDGTHTDFIPEVDELHQLVDYSMRFTERAARSEIIISTEIPEKGGETTVTTRFVPATAGLLRGMVKPAMWVNGVFQNKEEQRVMAELIAMHIWFSMRTGAATIKGNPAIQINDQIRMFERQSSDTYIHYVRSISSQHDLRSGEWTMQLETHWLGDGEDWVITSRDIPGDELTQESLRFLPVSETLVQWMENQQNNKLAVARLAGSADDLDQNGTQVIRSEDWVDPQLIEDIGSAS